MVLRRSCQSLTLLTGTFQRGTQSRCAGRTVVWVAVVAHVANNLAVFFWYPLAETEHNSKVGSRGDFCSLASGPECTIVVLPKATWQLSASFPRDWPGRAGVRLTSLRNP